MAAPKKRIDPEFYTTDQVQDAVNNAVIAIYRWDKLKNFKEKRGKSLREFTEGIVKALTEEVLLDETKPLSLLIPPEEIALALQSAVVLILYKYAIDNESKRKIFLTSLVEGFPVK